MWKTKENFPLSGERRYVVHIDLDAFFASVEVLLNPELKGKPLVVGGLPHERGVASTCSYEARKYGVHSGMPLRQCYKLCPQAVFVRGNYHLYQAFSEKFFRILHEYTPDVEEASLDEAYLEFTRCRHLYSSFSEAAKEIKRRVERELGLGVSVGTAFNKILAKLATKKAKPGGFFELKPGQEQEFLRELDISEIPGIGPKAQVMLRLLNVHKIADLWQLPLGTLRSLFGVMGDELYLLSRGMDCRSLAVEGKPKSFSRETTFLEDIWDRDLLLAHLAYLCDRLALSLRQEKYYARVIEVKARYSDFKTVSRRRVLSLPVQETNRIYRVAEELFLELWEGSRLALRLVGVKGSELVEARHLSLFELYSEREERLCQALDRVREKYGFNALLTVREKMLSEVYEEDRGRGFILKTASLTR
ncbi:MAG: DNA polymerase IV [Candidatus Aminicenantes bacterium]|nr:DNA polymerase IV [Candidatus Aminicenantes bacterium]